MAAKKEVHQRVWSQLAINRSTKTTEEKHPNKKKKELSEAAPKFKEADLIGLISRVQLLSQNYFFLQALQTSCIMRKLIFVYSFYKKKVMKSLPISSLLKACLLQSWVSLRKTCVLEEDAHGIKSWLHPGYTQPRLSWTKATQHP
jgi:hypothetical protein